MRILTAQGMFASLRVQTSDAEIFAFNTLDGPDAQDRLVAVAQAALGGGDD